MKQTKISTRLYTGFLLKLLGTLTVAGVGLYSANHLAELTSDIYEHPFTVSNTIIEIRADVLQSQVILNHMELSKSPAAIEAARQELSDLRKAADKSISIVREQYLGPKADVADIDKAMAEWRTSLDEAIRLMQAGRIAEAITVDNRRVDPLAQTALARIDVVRKFAAAKAVELKQHAADTASYAVRLIVTTLVLVLVGSVVLIVLLNRSVKQSLQQAVTAVQKLIEGSGDKVRVAEAIGAGDLSQEPVLSEPLKVDLTQLPDDEIGVLITAAVHLSEVQSTLEKTFQKMTQSLRQDRETVRAMDWLKSGQNELNGLMRGEQEVAGIANKVLAYLAEYLHAGVGALYLHDADREELYLSAAYAYAPRNAARERFGLGESLIGQAAREHRIIRLKDVPRDYLPIGSALGESIPKVISVIPLLHGKRLVGAIELASFREFTAIELEFLEAAREAIAIGLDMTLARHVMADLLEETQQQTEELRMQQEELQQSNEELEERAQMLEQQREKIRVSGQLTEAANEKLRQQAEELNRVSTYKSEFLANMSHELRTPLNSLLILSNLLAQNKEGNLTDKQTEFAATIHGAGKDLLDLISDILDLSKVEAGQMQLNFSALPVSGLCETLRALFTPVAKQKKLALLLRADEDVPTVFQGDEQRVQQILKNLVSNALKFTAQGEVTVRVFMPAGQDNPLPVRAIAFAVCDTGIGIPADKQQLIFQAFQQADGSISRKYGGTGLGLSISLQLARAMQGDIRMSSLEGEGSVFTLYLPLECAGEQVPVENKRAFVTSAAVAPLPVQREESTFFAEALPDDRGRLTQGDKSILIIEDDLGFAGILQDMIRKRGFSVLVAANGESGVALADRFVPSAIVLDVMLPSIDGWRVMSSLKDNPRTRHIPVHFITCVEDRQKALSMGAIGFATKPVSMEQLNGVLQTIEKSIAKSVKQLLIVEDQAVEAKSLVALLEEDGVETTVAASGDEAIALLSTGSFDCMVLDLGLPDMSGLGLLERIAADESMRRIPVIVHSGRELNHEDERKLRRYTESIIIKGARSPERLLNEVALFLHLVESNLHPDKQRMIRTAIDKEAMLEGRKVLLVDDDMRNIFSLSSILAEKNMQVIEAENGLEAIARLNEHPDVAVVLMDIMMPQMDGYTAMRAIRKDPRFATTPIIAMTAKALKGDHEKCIEAGASDYIAKPIEMEKLFSLIRVWTFKAGNFALTEE